MKYLDENGLLYLWVKIKDKLNKVDQLSDEVENLKVLLVNGNEVEY